MGLVRGGGLLFRCFNGCAEMMKDLMKLKKQLETEGFSGFLPDVVDSRDHLPPAEGARRCISEWVCVD